MININIPEVNELILITKRLAEKSNMPCLEDYFGQEISDYGEIILDLLNIPRDNTVNYCPKLDGERFCRDQFYDILYNFIFGYEDYSVEEVIDMLLTLNE